MCTKWRTRITCKYCHAIKSSTEGILEKCSSAASGRSCEHGAAYPGGYDLTTPDPKPNYCKDCGERAQAVPPGAPFPTPFSAPPLQPPPPYSAPHSMPNMPAPAAPQPAVVAPPSTSQPQMPTVPTLTMMPFTGLTPTAFMCPQGAAAPPPPGTYDLKPGFVNGYGVMWVYLK